MPSGILFYRVHEGGLLCIQSRCLFRIYLKWIYYEPRVYHTRCTVVTRTKCAEEVQQLASFCNEFILWVKF